MGQQSETNPNCIQLQDCVLPKLIKFIKCPSTCWRDCRYIENYQFTSAGRPSPCMVEGLFFSQQVTSLKVRLLVRTSRLFSCMIRLRLASSHPPHGCRTLSLRYHPRFETPAQQVVTITAPPTEEMVKNSRHCPTAGITLVLCQAVAQILMH